MTALSINCDAEYVGILSTLTIKIKVKKLNIQVCLGVVEAAEALWEKVSSRVLFFFPFFDVWGNCISDILSVLLLHPSECKTAGFITV